MGEIEREMGRVRDRIGDSQRRAREMEQRYLGGGEGSRLAEGSRCGDGLGGSSNSVAGRIASLLGRQMSYDQQLREYRQHFSLLPDLIQT